MRKFLGVMSFFLFLLSISPTAQAANAVTQIKDTYRGAYVMIPGTVLRFIDEDEFLLQDETGRIRVYIGYQNRMPVRPGDKVTVEGFIDFDIVKEIYAWTITKEDGEIIELDRREN